jgi:hypothetical protein
MLIAINRIDCNKAFFASELTFSDDSPSTAASRTGFHCMA